MHSRFKTVSVVMRVFLLLAILFGASAATRFAIAQGRSTEKDDSDDRRSSFRSWRRDRSESRESKSEERKDDEAEDKKSKKDDKDEGPSIAMTDYARKLVEQHDKNGNKMLDGDERGSLRPPASLADANNDNVITTEELVAKLSGASAKAASGPSSTPTNDKEGDRESSDRPESRRDYRGRSQTDSKTATTSKRVLTWLGNSSGAPEGEKKTRRTYRFTPATEKLPTGLPSWFKSQDKNGDGQVAMSEYSRSWSKSTVTKFRGYDLNDDGVITAEEAKK